jgi:hypothetical protein
MDIDEIDITPCGYVCAYMHACMHIHVNIQHVWKFMPTDSTLEFFDEHSDEDVSL